MDVCPTGWHSPSDAEWKELEITLGMSQEEAEIITGKIECSS
ncbi:MAG: FISUMP domain-containing protein [Candidatus Cyclobacteriaceae bacterium M3_2C_046]